GHGRGARGGGIAAKRQLHTPSAPHRLLQNRIRRTACWRSEMLRRLRRSSTVRAALCLAVLLATAAAFGLHPEPPDEGNAAPAAFSSADTVRSGSHICVACLTHATSLPAPLSAALLAPSAAPDPAPARMVPAPPRLTRTPCSGLSPPSLS